MNTQLIAASVADRADILGRLEGMSIGFSCLVWGVHVERVSAERWVNRYISGPWGADETIEAILEF